MKKKIISYFNKCSSFFGFEVVPTWAGRHIELSKYLLEKDGELNVLNLAIQMELKRLSGRPFNILQIGANDGNRYDPYKKLIERYGFRGVLVEPDPVVFEKLKKNYENQPQLSFENVAIGKTPGHLPFYLLQSPEGERDAFSVYSSLDLNAVKVARKRNFRGKRFSIVESEVPVITFKELLVRNKIEEISLLAVDTEGYDYEILRTIDFKKESPSIIEFEHACLSPHIERDCQAMLLSNGYKLIRGFGSDTLAVNGLVFDNDCFLG
jgi:FkbM family methyltransferase